MWDQAQCLGRDFQAAIPGLRYRGFPSQALGSLSLAPSEAARTGASGAGALTTASD